MMRSICVAFVIMMVCTTSQAKELFRSDSGNLLDDPIIITILIEHSKATISTITKNFSLSSEGHEEAESVHEGKRLKSSGMSWSLQIRGTIVDQSEDGVYIIQLKGHCQYREHSNSTDSESGSNEVSEIQVEMTFEAGTRIKLGEEKVIASQNNQQLKILIERDK